MAKLFSEKIIFILPLGFFLCGSASMIAHFDGKDTRAVWISIGGIFLYTIIVYFFVKIVYYLLSYISEEVVIPHGGRKKKNKKRK